MIAIGSLPYVLLFHGILRRGVKQCLSTFMLWLALDVVILTALIQQNGNYLVYVVFTIGTLFVNIALILKKQFEWDYFDIFVVVLVFICIRIFYVSGPYGATIATTTALTIAALPQLRSTWREPEKTPTLPYFLFFLASLLAVILAKEWSVPERLPQTSSMLFSLIMVIISLRKTSLKLLGI